MEDPDESEDSVDAEDTQETEKAEVTDEVATEELETAVEPEEEKVVVKSEEAKVAVEAETNAASDDEASRASQEDMVGVGLLLLYTTSTTFNPNSFVNNFAPTTTPNSVSSNCVTIAKSLLTLLSSGGLQSQRGRHGWQRGGGAGGG